MKAFRALIVLFAMVLVPADPAAGQDVPPGHDLYFQFCSNCHGTDLQGGLGPNLVDDEWLHGRERAAQMLIVANGLVEAGMPPFGSALSDDQIAAVMDFIDAAAADPAVAPAVVIDTLATLDYALNVEVFADSLEIPWAIDFLDRRTAIVTERPGGIRLVRNGRLDPDPVVGTPEVLHEGQGGMMDVAVDPDYARNGWIYLSYSHALPAEDGERPPAMTRIVRGRLDGNRWVDEEVLFEAPHDLYRTTRHHYGSRIVFDEDGFLYFVIGDRGGRDHAQDLSRPNGKVHRIYPDGSVPADNPFVGIEGALPTIYSYGHRNPQGLAIDPQTGSLWAAEHGPLGGDELNVVVGGRNYGWPEITYGINYNGSIITRNRARVGMEQPTYYWRPSIAVSGTAFYDDPDVFSLWRGRLLVSALAYEEVRLVHVVDDRVVHEEVVLKDMGRVREAVPGPDGAIYVVQNDPGRVLRITPRKEHIRGRL